MSLFKNLFNSENIPKFGSSINTDSQISENVNIQENVILGVKYKRSSKPPIIGKNSILRSNTVIYNDVEAGDDFKTGHNVLIRENTKIGNDVLIGTNSVIEGNCTIGTNVRIQSNVYIPTNTIIEDNVFIGPCACFTNDKYPVKIDFDLKGPILKKGASIGANSTFLSDVEIGEGAMVAAGAVVTKDVPPFFLAIGAPAKIKPLPKRLKTLNRL